LAGLAATVPVRIPGTTYGRAMAARDRLLVALAFGRARRTFACGGYEVPVGWTVYLALHLFNRDPSIHSEVSTAGRPNRE
jgi:cytochrome P450